MVSIVQIIPMVNETDEEIVIEDCSAIFLKLLACHDASVKPTPRRTDMPAFPGLRCDRLISLLIEPG